MPGRTTPQGPIAYQSDTLCRPDTFLQGTQIAVGWRLPGEPYHRPPARRRGVAAIWVRLGERGLK